MFFKALLPLLFLFGATTSFAASPYDILGVSKNATPDEIKTAYRTLAKKFHPDMNPNDPTAKEKFIEIQAAYDAVSGPAQKAKSDRISDKADKVGKEYSNPKWPYEPTTHRFYDNRTKKWLHMDTLFSSFYSDEGWLFYPTDGRYLSTDLGAEWNPEDGRGWTRGVSNFNREYIPIDPHTGFALSVKYKPTTVSDASHLFDEIFNPVILMNQKAGRKSRVELLKQLENLEWSRSQTADFIERAKAHIRIISHPDMEANFTTQVYYVNSFMEALLDNPSTRANPEIVVEFIRAMPNSYETLSKELLIKEEWLEHSNASVWFEELFRHEQGAMYFIEAMFRSDTDPQLGVKKFERLYSFMLKAGMTPNTVKQLVTYLGCYEEAAFNAFKNQLLALVRTAEFSELIASIDTKETKGVEKFLAWYKNHEPKDAQIFLNALGLPGTSRDDFYRLSEDRSEWSLHEDEYRFNRNRTTRARLDFLRKNLPTIKKPKPVETNAIVCARALT